MRMRAALTLIACLLLTGCGSSSSGSSSTAGSTTASAHSTTQAAATNGPQKMGFEGIPIEQGADLASPGTTGTGTVDGIQCAPAEQLVYHIHAHLQVYVNGSPRALPGGIGIPGSQVVGTAEGPVAAGG